MGVLPPVLATGTNVETIRSLIVVAAVLLDAGSAVASPSDSS
jgi:hypothetical protein